MMVIMEGAPKSRPHFETMEETPHGAILRRVREAHDAAYQAAPEYKELNPRQSEKLSKTLKMLATVGAVGFAGVSAKASYDHSTESIGGDRHKITTSAESFSETVDGQATEAQTKTFKADIPVGEVIDKLGYDFGNTKTSTPEMVEQYPTGEIVFTFADKVASFLPQNEAEWQTALEGFREYADVPTVGAEDYTREAYLRDMVEFKDGVPRVVQDELRNLLPALAAQESAFKGDAESGVGAKGILQFMPATWERYTDSRDVSLSLVKQTEVAGEYLSDIYTALDRRIGESRWEILRSKFNTEEAFYRELVAPLVLNSFNAGEGRVAELVQFYVDSKQPHDMPTGRDLFFDITQYGLEATHGKHLERYGKDSSEYVPKIYAKHTLLTKSPTTVEQYAMGAVNLK